MGLLETSDCLCDLATCSYDNSDSDYEYDDSCCDDLCSNCAKILEIDDECNTDTYCSDCYCSEVIQNLESKEERDSYEEATTNTTCCRIDGDGHRCGDILLPESDGFYCEVCYHILNGSFEYEFHR